MKITFAKTEISKSNIIKLWYSIIFVIILFVADQIIKNLSLYNEIKVQGNLDNSITLINNLTHKSIGLTITIISFLFLGIIFFFLVVRNIEIKSNNKNTIYKLFLKKSWFIQFLLILVFFGVLSNTIDRLHVAPSYSQLFDKTSKTSAKFCVINWIPISFSHSDKSAATNIADLMLLFGFISGLIFQISLFMNNRRNKANINNSSN